MRESIAIEENRSVLGRFLTYFAPHRFSIIVALIGAIFVGAGNSLMALVAKILMDIFSGVSSAISSGSQLSIVLEQKIGKLNLYHINVDGFEQARVIVISILLATLVVVILKNIVHFGKEFLLWRVTYKILLTLKQQIFDVIVRLPMEVFDREKSGEMLARLTYDVSQIEHSIRSTVRFTKATIYAIMYILLMFFLDWMLSLIALLVFPLSALLLKYFGSRIRHISRQISVNVADYVSLLDQVIGGSKIIKAFGRQSDTSGNFKRKIEINYRYSMRAARLGTLHAPLQEILSTIGTGLVVVFCFWRMLTGAMTIGDLSAFLVLLTNAYKPIKELGEANIILQRALASGKRIFGLLDEPDEADIIESGKLKPSPVNGAISFQSVEFAYIDSRNTDENKAIPPTVLKGLTLDIQAGETIALVGPSGGGKSTLLNLIPRFYKLPSGKILIDGVNIAEWDIDYLRQQIAIVPPRNGVVHRKHYGKHSLF